MLRIYCWHIVLIFVLSVDIKCHGWSFDDTETVDSAGQLLCRKCGHEVTTSPNLRARVTSKVSQRQRNQTIIGISGVLVQQFENPAGEIFDVIVAERADVYYNEKAFDSFTWFPGYTWRVAHCPSCGSHLGWFYESMSTCQSKDSCGGDSHTNKEDADPDSFVGLILGSVFSADFASSLTMVSKPKAMGA